MSTPKASTVATPSVPKAVVPKASPGGSAPAVPKATPAAAPATPATAPATTAARATTRAGIDAGTSPAATTARAAPKATPAAAVKTPVAETAHPVGPPAGAKGGPIVTPAGVTVRPPTATAPGASAPQTPAPLAQHHEVCRGRWSECTPRARPLMLLRPPPTQHTHTHTHIFARRTRLATDATRRRTQVEYVEEDQKHARLLAILRVHPGATVVFVETEREVEALSQLLPLKSLPATALYTDADARARDTVRCACGPPASVPPSSCRSRQAHRHPTSQPRTRARARLQVLGDLRRGKATVLVTTDAASRGVDLPRGLNVVHFDLPSAASAVERLGARLRRAEGPKPGTVVSFFNDRDAWLAGALVQALRGARQPVPDWLAACAAEVAAAQHGRYGGRADGLGFCQGAGRSGWFAHPPGRLCVCVCVCVRDHIVHQSRQRGGRRRGRASS